MPLPFCSTLALIAIPQLQGKVELTGGYNFSIKGEKIPAGQTRCTTLHYIIIQPQRVLESLDDITSSLCHKQSASQVVYVTSSLCRNYSFLITRQFAKICLISTFKKTVKIKQILQGQFWNYKYLKCKHQLLKFQLTILIGQFFKIDQRIEYSAYVVGSQGVTQLGGFVPVL